MLSKYCAILVHVHQHHGQILIEVVFEMQAPTVNLNAANAAGPVPDEPENSERVQPEALIVSDFSCSGFAQYFFLFSLQSVSC